MVYHTPGHLFQDRPICYIAATVATWVIGDIHGCFDSLQDLWSRLDLDPAEDRLWLVGDLVNRGPKNLEVLRWARRLNGLMGERMAVVLGNHDLHLLALAAGINPPKPLDTLEDVLAAPDREELLAWLASRSLLHRDEDVVMVHAGLLPHWSLTQAERQARELERALGTSDRDLILSKQPAEPVTEPRTEPLEDRIEQLRRTCNALTLLRTCNDQGEPCKFSGAPAETPEGCRPWFDLWPPLEHGVTLVCGHWAALGLHLGPGLMMLDSGCVWGGALTAVRLEDMKIIQQPTAERPQDLP